MTQLLGSKMVMRKLSSDIQSLFCASTQIRSYKRAIEELVYNSLDAKSTSIAIRINIEQNSIQVIDNGSGVSKINFILVGHRHATSKCVDLSTLKSVPNTYGYRGQSLASIIDVSKIVKITSRCENSDETWEKRFCRSKEQNLGHASKRPSKGTTIDIAGFLYNLKIQKNAVVSLSELNDIKSFLEQLSLVHNNISVSLRDDVKNEIVFKLHKNRDIYQTLTSLFGIERKDVQELKVEKSLYKVTAYIGIDDKEICQKHWVYLNGRVLQNSKVQKIVNDNLKRHLKLNLQNMRTVKSKNPYNQDEEKREKGIPFYFIFVTCPYNDYDITYASKQTEIEFKNWEYINKLIEKMAKFFAGDIHVKPVKNQVQNQHRPENTRDQVKKIMDKILGSNPKRIEVSQMQNGIKGKVTKRKPKKKVDKITVPTVLPASNIKKINKKEMENLNVKTTNNLQTLPNNEQMLNSKIHKGIKLAKNMRKKTNELVRSTKNLANKKSKIINENKKNTSKVSESIEDNITQYQIACQDKQIINKRNTQETKKENRKLTAVNNKGKILKLDCKKLKNITSNNRQISKTIAKKVYKESHRNLKDPLIKIFNDPTGSVKRRCNLLANKVNNLMSYKRKRKRKIFINETVQYSNIVRDNKNYSVRKKIGEIVIHDYIPKPTGLSPCTSDDRLWNKRVIQKPHKSSYDLVQTILKTQETRNSYIDEVNVTNVAFQELPNNDISAQSRELISKPDYSEEDNTTISIPLLPILTFESHNYVQNWHQNCHNFHSERNQCENDNEKSANVRFITTQSRENFLIPTIRPKQSKKMNSKIKHLEFQSNQIDLFTKNADSYEETSYTIEFSKSHENYIFDDNDVLHNSSMPFNMNETEKETRNDDGTYSIKHNSYIEKEYYLQNDLTYTINHHSTFENKRCEEERYYSEDVENTVFIEDSTEILYSKQEKLKTDLIDKENLNSNNKPRDKHNMNVVFISKSQEQQASNDFDPLNICETVHSQEFEERETSCREWNDSLFNGELDIDSFLCDRNAYTQCNLYESFNEACLNLNIENRHNLVNDNFKGLGLIKEKDRLDTTSNLHKDLQNKCDQIVNKVLGNDMGNLSRNKDANVVKDIQFNFKNRLRFVPKGMSQIFTKCQSRNVCDYNIEQDYFEEEIYNNFADNVQLKCEIFEPVVQHVKETTTKAIEKVKNKVNKDNASLIFNGETLKQAKCLRQVDNKFIAAKIQGTLNQKVKVMEYLVLFDQHAVHERIRLENNLSDYFNGTEWKSIQLDNITLNLTKDELLYLHNYKNKFSQLGLQWVILTNCEVSIIAIPEAILGKNPRQVEIVMKAVKSLIAEEINAIKSQSGCISLYPKSIMDLVFSEACRYAIKFGDPLSKRECKELLNALSECKVPFQCAHGRPVMAVLLDIKEDYQKYQINPKSLQKWIKKEQVRNK